MKIKKSELIQLIKEEITRKKRMLSETYVVDVGEVDLDQYIESVAREMVKAFKNHIGYEAPPAQMIEEINEIIKEALREYEITLERKVSKTLSSQKI